MDHEEKQDLITKIFDVEQNPKTARLSMNRFIQKATETDGEPFLEYLTSSDNIKKKIARNIVGQLAISKALDILLPEFLESTENLTFLPDLEYKEKLFYTNLVEILESIFLIVVNEKDKKDHSGFLKKLEDIFKKTKNDDLRFSLIKLIAFLGTKIEHFSRIYSDLGDKEKRALFYVYTLKNEENRMVIYKKGYEEKNNFDFLISNLIKIKDGREFLSQKLLEAGDREKELILKKLSDTNIQDFNNTLIELLKDKNKFITELSKDILLRTLEGTFKAEQFINYLKTGYSHNLVKNSLQLINKFVKNNLEDILLDAFQSQTIHVNKNEILVFLIQLNKQKKSLSLEFSKKLLPVLNSFFETYKTENDDMLVSILKLYTVLKYDQSLKVKKIKTMILRFVKNYEKTITTMVKNKAHESLNGLNKIAENLEENEQKLKHVLNLMEIDPAKIESNRLISFKNELDELPIIDLESIELINRFLFKIFENSPIDWKKRVESVKIIEAYGNKNALKRLIELEESEKSFGVKVAIKKSIEILEKKFKEDKSILILSPLFYINKLISNFFTTYTFKCQTLKEIDKLYLLKGQQYNYIFISDAYHDKIDFAVLKQMTEQKGGSIVFISATRNPQQLYDTFGRDNISILQKPFNDKSISEVANLPATD